MTSNPELIHSSTGSGDTVRPGAGNGRGPVVDGKAVQPFPNSRKIHVQGSRDDIRVPMREITCSNTISSSGIEVNHPITVYDTSGPYTDPAVTIDIRQGLAGGRGDWIRDRDDTEQLDVFSSAYGRKRQADGRSAELRFPHSKPPRRAKSGSNVTQMHYARRGIVTPEMEFIAIRENQRLDEYREHCLLKRHAGQPLGARLPARNHSGIRPFRGCGRQGHYSRQYQSSGIGTDDHRPEFPGQDQCEHR